MCLPFLTFPSFLKKPINKKQKKFIKRNYSTIIKEVHIATLLKVQQHAFLTKTFTVITNCTCAKYVGTILPLPQTL